MTLTDLEYEGATVGYCQLSWLLVSCSNGFQFACSDLTARQFFHESTGLMVISVNFIFLEFLKHLGLCPGLKIIIIINIRLYSMPTGYKVTKLQHHCVLHFSQMKIKILQTFKSIQPSITIFSAAWPRDLNLWTGISSTLDWLAGQTVQESAR